MVGVFVRSVARLAAVFVFYGLYKPLRVRHGALHVRSASLRIRGVALHGLGGPLPASSVLLRTLGVVLRVRRKVLRTCTRAKATLGRALRTRNSVLLEPKSLYASGYWPWLAQNRGGWRASRGLGSVRVGR